jgi:hypothetical protein
MRVLAKARARAGLDATVVFVHELPQLSVERERPSKAKNLKMRIGFGVPLIQTGIDARRFRWGIAGQRR